MKIKRTTKDQSYQVAGQRTRAGKSRVQHKEGNHAVLRAALVKWEIRNGIIFQ
jgi:hypothetical protein